MLARFWRMAWKIQKEGATISARSLGEKRKTRVSDLTEREKDTEANQIAEEEPLEEAKKAEEGRGHYKVAKNLPQQRQTIGTSVLLSSR